MWCFAKTQRSRVKDWEHKLNIVNPDASLGASTGWTVELGNWSTASVDPSARVSSPYFSGGNQPDSKVYQELDLLAQLPGVSSVADIDALNGTFEFAAWQSNYATNDPGSISIRFKDAARTVLETHTGPERMLNRYWRHTKLERVVPAGTQYVDIIMRSRRTSGTNNNANFDDLTATFKTKNLKPHIVGTTSAWAGASDNILTFSKPPGVKEGDILVITCASRNKYQRDYGGPEGGGWSLALGADMGSNWLTVPWTNSTNEQCGIWWRLAGAEETEPSTYDLNIVDNGDDYAVGTMIAIRGVHNPSLLGVTYIHNSQTIPSIEMKKGGVVLALWNNASSGGHVGNHSETYPFQGVALIHSYGNVCHYAAALTETIDGFTGGVTGSGAGTSYACNAMLSFQPNSDPVEIPVVPPLTDLPDPVWALGEWDSAVDSHDQGAWPGINLDAGMTITYEIEETGHGIYGPIVVSIQSSPTIFVMHETSAFGSQLNVGHSTGTNYDEPTMAAINAQNILDKVVRVVHRLYPDGVTWTTDYKFSDGTSEQYTTVLSPWSLGDRLGGNIYLGQNGANESPDWQMSGKLRDIAVYDEVLDGAATQRYLDPPNGLLLSMDGADAGTEFKTSGTARAAVTAMGGATTSIVTPKFGSSKLLFGALGYLEIEDVPEVQFGTGDFCMDFWAWLSSTMVDPYLLVCKGSGTPKFQPYFHSINTATPLLNFYANGTQYLGGGIDMGLAKDTWGHVEISRTDGVVYIFANGVLKTTFACTAAPPAGTLKLGWDSGSAYSSGHGMDEFRLQKGTFGHTEDFTPPTLPYSLIT